MLLLLLQGTGRATPAHSNTEPAAAADIALVCSTPAQLSCCCLMLVHLLLHYLMY
jgi:hypothetical protein